MKNILKTASLSLVIASLSLVIGVGFSNSATALSGNEFKAGRIIDDNLFYNGTTMTAAEIQNFLNSKVPTCDTWGTQPYGGTTRAQYGASRGYPAPYTCIKDHKQDTGYKAGQSGLCSAIEAKTNRSAAQIIDDVARACHISQKALIVMLQKEQGLVTDDWPWSIQYRSAMGYGCPDTAACDAQYYGFFNQVYNAALQFQRYKADPTYWNHVPFMTNQVAYQANAPGCGSRSVYIENYATAGLYNYTPYTPNQKALDNLYGSGDGCSAYGNRNFWRYYNDWFGSTTLYNANISVSKGLTTNIANRPVYSGDTVTATYEVFNSASYATEVGGLGICARLNGKNADFGFIHRNTLVAQSKKTITFTKKIETTGTLELFICSYNEALGGWASTGHYPYNYSSPSVTRSVKHSVLDNPYLTTGITVTPTRPGVGEPVTATMAIRNAANTAVNIGSMVIAGRDSAGKNVDFGIVNDVTVGPDWGTYNYSRSRTFSTPGKHTFYVANWKGVWSTRIPISLDNTIARQVVIDVVDNPHISSGVKLTPVEPTVGEPVTATLTLRNTGPSPVNIGSLVIAGRDPAGKNVDFKIVNDVIVPANGTYVYSQTRTFSALGEYKFYVANWKGIWSTQRPVSFDQGITRTTSIQIK